MWPYLFGSGWFWGVLVSAGFLAVLVVLIRTLFVGAGDGDARGIGGRDRLQQIWHEYEQGDLTTWEFARLISPRPAVQYTAAATGKMPVRRSAPAH